MLQSTRVAVHHSSVHLYICYTCPAPHTHTHTTSPHSPQTEFEIELECRNTWCSLPALIVEGNPNLYQLEQVHVALQQLILVVRRTPELSRWLGNNPRKFRILQAFRDGGGGEGVRNYEMFNFYSTVYLGGRKSAYSKTPVQ